MRTEPRRTKKAKQAIEQFGREIDVLKLRARKIDTDATVDYQAHMKRIDDAYTDALNGILRTQSPAQEESDEDIEHVEVALRRLKREIQKARTSFQ